MNARGIRAFALLRRTRTATIAAVAILVLLPPAAGAARPSSDACVVKAGGTTYDSVQAALDASSTGVKLRVFGTCVGPTVVSKNAAISGSGGNGPGATLDGDLAGSVITVNSGASVVVDRLTITNGYNQVDGGGGILNHGTLTIRRSLVTDNVSDRGGGLRNDGSATVVDSEFVFNGGYYGGDIYNTGTLNISGSTLSAGRGRVGNNLLNDGTAIVTNTLITANDEGLIPFLGGGISNGGDLTLRDSTIRSNHSLFGGGIFNVGTARLIRSTVSGNEGLTGGGVMNGPEFFGVPTGDELVILVDSTIVDNTADIGGGINNRSRVQLDRRSRIGGNTATGGQGGGIYNEPAATVTGITGGTFTPPNTPDDCVGCP